MSEDVKKGAGEDGDGDNDDEGRISPEHPSPILYAPRDNISRKGKSLTPTMHEYADVLIIMYDYAQTCVKVHDYA